ncbi:hypothetical protein L209DRAFT_570502 [Thermothelomyces heterothallicus CBS 203.75]
MARVCSFPVSFHSANFPAIRIQKPARCSRVVALSRCALFPSTFFFLVRFLPSFSFFLLFSFFQSRRRGNVGTRRISGGISPSPKTHPLITSLSRVPCQTSDFSVIEYTRQGRTAPTLPVHCTYLYMALGMSAILHVVATE